MKDNEITLKEFVRAVPRLAELLFWGFAGYVVIAGFIVLGLFGLGLFAASLFPETAKTIFMAFIEWAKTNGVLLGVIVATVLLLGFVAFIRKITIELAKDMQKG